MTWSANDRSRAGGLLACREQVARDQGDVVDVGDRPVGEGRGGQAGHHVVARVPPAIFDVRGEPVVEELQRLVPDRLLAADAHRVGRELGAERVVVFLGNAEEVGDDEQRERLRVLADELALALAEDLVDLPVGEPPHERLVLLQALRRDEAHQQRAVRGVLRRVEGRQLVAERQPVAVLLDDRR